MKPSAGVLVCVLAVSLVSTAVAQTPDPLIGKWRFNAAKSKFSPGPSPKGGVVTYTMSGNCLTAVNDSVEAVGPALKVQFACLNADGKEYPISGSPDYDTNVYKRIDAYTAEYTRKRDGRVVRDGNEGAVERW